jgi:hypothetical protein
MLILDRKKVVGIATINTLNGITIQVFENVVLNFESKF